MYLLVSGGQTSHKANKSHHYTPLPSLPPPWITCKIALVGLHSKHQRNLAPTPPCTSHCLLSTYVSSDLQTLYIGPDLCIIGHLIEWNKYCLIYFLFEVTGPKEWQNGGVIYTGPLQGFTSFLWATITHNKRAGTLPPWGWAILHTNTNLVLGKWP